MLGVFSREALFALKTHQRSCGTVITVTKHSLQANYSLRVLKYSTRLPTQLNFFEENH